MEPKRQQWEVMRLELEHAKLSEDILRLNLHEQYRLLEFLGSFIKTATRHFMPA